MSGGITAATLATYAGYAVTAYSAYSATQAGKGSKAQIPTPAPPPQAAKAPERTNMMAANMAAARAGGAQAGNSGTFLTGPAGVDSGKLNLGKNTLLGQ